MAFRWTEDKIGWFLDAAGWVEFHGRLAQELLPYLTKEDTLCDLGCGLGVIDLLLAPHVVHITAVDAEPMVIENLAVRARQAGVDNLRAVNADSVDVKERFDIVLMSFFGCKPEMFGHYMALAQKRLIRVVNVENSGNLYPGEYRRTKKNLAHEVEQQLDAEGLEYTMLRRSWEFGQPLHSREDGLAYLQSLAPDAPPAALADFLDEAAQETGRKNFPLYLPNKKDVGIFIIEVAAP